MVCRCSNPTGPFSDRDSKSCLTENGGTMILGSHDDVYVPGGHGVIYDEVLDSVILYYHYCKFDSSRLCQY
jgi:arabinan endo-1,5-alpha-L-arabinosidase